MACNMVVGLKHVYIMYTYICRDAYYNVRTHKHIIRTRYFIACIITRTRHFAKVYFLLSSRSSRVHSGWLSDGAGRPSRGMPILYLLHVDSIICCYGIISMRPRTLGTRLAYYDDDVRTYVDGTIKSIGLPDGRPAIILIIIYIYNPCIAQIVSFAKIVYDISEYKIWVPDIRG